MRPTEALFQLADAEGIRVCFYPLQPFYSGLYVRRPGMPPVIGLDVGLLRRERELRAVFAEELGHHFTTSGCWVTLASSEASRLSRDRVELRAIRWAIDYLIDTTELLRAVHRGESAWDLADRFLVPAPWVLEKMAWLRGRWGKAA